MPPPHILDGLLRDLELGLRALLLILLLRRSLIRRYAFFSIYLAGGLVRSIALLAIPYQAPLYARVWAGTQPLIWVLQFLAVLEVMSLIVEQYPKLGSAAKVITSSSFAAGVVAGLVFSFIDFGTAKMPWWLDVSWTVTKSVSWATVAILCAQMVWFALFPVSMVRAVRYHRCLFTVYAGILPGIMFLVAGLGTARANQIANQVYLAFCSVLLVLWCLALRGKNEFCLLDPPKRKGLLKWCGIGVSAWVGVKMVWGELLS